MPSRFLGRRLVPLLRSNRAFLRFAASYILILVITLAIGAVTYVRTLTMVERDAAGWNLSTIERHRDLMDSRFAEIENVVANLAMDYRVRTFLAKSDPLRPEDYYSIRQMFLGLPLRTVGDSLIRDLVIYFADSNVVVSSRYATARARLFYEGFMRFESYDFDEFRRAVLRDRLPDRFWPASRVTGDGTAASCVTLVQPLPADAFDEHRGAILVLLDESAIQGGMADLPLGDDGWLAIVNRAGEVVSSSRPLEPPASLLGGGRERKQSGVFYDAPSHLHVVYAVSSRTGWTYAAAVPSRFFYEKVHYIRRIYLVALLCVFGIGLLLSLIQAHRNLAPLKRIVLRLSEAQDTGAGGETAGDFDFISGRIGELIEHNRARSAER